MDGGNIRDQGGMDAAFHFPNVRIASGWIHALDGPMARSEDFFEKFIDDTGWHCTLWDYRRSVQSTDSKVSFAVQFTRYEEDNSAIEVYASL